MYWCDENEKKICVKINKKFIFEVKEGNLKWEIQNTRKKKGNLDYKNQENELNKMKITWKS